MAGTLLVDVVTPTSTLYSGEVRQVIATSPDGEFGVLPMHAPMVCELGRGELRLTMDNATADVEVYALQGGYLQVALDHVTLLTDRAVAVKGLDTADLKAQYDALKAERDALPDDDEHIDVRSDLQREMDWLSSVLAITGHYN
ncbi:MAG: ATP synthase F1 subunit epsilon [Actinomycetia bacterium]|nr:ATP synthase F1 subunit epsilon [Actinomycetes bacterium]